MPTTRAVQRWLLERPQFAEAMWDARMASCQPLTGRRPVWCPETAQEILNRVAEGESLIGVCKDPLLPAYNTVYLWRGRYPEFDEALRAAQDMRAERIAEGGWELARSLAAEGMGKESVDRGRIRALEVMLRQLRWHVGTLSPNRFGAKKAVEVEKPPRQLEISVKTLVIEPGEDGEPTVFWIAPNSETGRVERVDAGKWPGVEKAKGFVGDSASKRPRPGVRPLAGEAADDPEG
jgi:hypothetical protein